jgi:hypothetical protein
MEGVLNISNSSTFPNNGLITICMSLTCAAFNHGEKNLVLVLAAIDKLSLLYAISLNLKTVDLFFPISETSFNSSSAFMMDNFDINKPLKSNRYSLAKSCSL